MHARRVGVGTLPIVTLLIFAPILMMSIQPPARAADSKTMPLTVEITLNGSILAPGSYQISWVSHSPEATVTFARGGRVIATAMGTWVDRGTKYERDAVVYSNNPDGSHTLREIRIAGKSQALVFTP